MSPFLYMVLLLSATTFALRPARLVRQFNEPCEVACGGGWCCFLTEICVAKPGDIDDGGWGCIFQGLSNDDGSPITDVPYNPSQDAGIFTSADSIASAGSSLISSLTSALSLTSFSFSSITSLPSAGSTPTAVAPTLTTDSGTLVTSASPSPTGSTTASSSKVSSNPVSSLKVSTSSTKSDSSRTTPSLSSSGGSATTPTSSSVANPNTNIKYAGNRMAIAFMVSFIATMMVAYLV